MDRAHAKGVRPHFARSRPLPPARVVANALKFEEPCREVVDRVAPDDQHPVACRLAHHAIKPTHDLGRRSRAVTPRGERPLHGRIPQLKPPDDVPVVGDEVDLDEFHPPVGEADEIRANAPRPFRVCRIDRQRRLARIRLERTIPQPRPRAHRLHAPRDVRHRHAPARIDGAPLSARLRRVAAMLARILPAVVHDRERTVRHGLARLGVHRLDEELRVGKEVRRRVASIRAIPVVVAVDGCGRQTWRGTHQTAEFPPRREGRLAVRPASRDERAEGERTVAQFNGIRPGPHVQEELKSLRPRPPAGECVRLHPHPVAIGAPTVRHENVPRHRPAARHLRRIEPPPGAVAVRALPHAAQGPRVRPQASVPDDTNA